MDDLIRRLKERIQYCPAVEFDASCGRANDKLEPIPPHPSRPPVSMDVVEEIERTLGFRLPTLMRRLYTEVGNGQFGPNWGLLRLRQAEGEDIWEPEVSEMSVEGWFLVHRDMEKVHGPKPDDWPEFPEGSLLISEGGCLVNYWLDCATEHGRVFVDDGDKYGQGYEFETLSPTLEAWLTRWLDQPWPTLRYDDPEGLAASVAGT
jgi:hypothetical protein